MGKTTILTSPDSFNWTEQTFSISSSALTNIFYSTEKNTFIIIGDGKIFTCNFCTISEIRSLEIDKRLSRVEPDYVII
jgi:ABC-type uncharacterized transport system auxiliary subunit